LREATRFRASNHDGAIYSDSVETEKSWVAALKREPRFMADPPRGKRTVEHSPIILIDSDGPATSLESLRFDMREAQHRMKNMVAIVQAIARQTMRNAETMAEFEKMFTGRLNSFCFSIDRLVDTDWVGMDVRELVVGQLAPFVSLERPQLEVNGPDVWLNPTAAHNIGMALHELAANATKYGALSVSEGKVRVAWKFIDDKRQSLQLSWNESDGPPVVQATQSGFGRRILEQIVPAAVFGHTVYEFESTGVRWTLDLPHTALVTPQG